jgi:hypothetical protein
VFNFPGYKRDANQNYTKISSLSVRLAITRAITARNAGKDMAKQESLDTAGGNAS